MLWWNLSHVHTVFLLAVNLFITGLLYKQLYSIFCMYLNYRSSLISLLIDQIWQSIIFYFLSQCLSWCQHMWPLLFKLLKFLFVSQCHVSLLGNGVHARWRPYVTAKSIRWPVWWVYGSVLFSWAGWSHSSSASAWICAQVGHFQEWVSNWEKYEFKPCICKAQFLTKHVLIEDKQPCKSV